MAIYSNFMDVVDYPIDIVKVGINAYVFKPSLAGLILPAEDSMMAECKAFGYNYSPFRDVTRVAVAPKIPKRFTVLYRSEQI